MNNQNHRHHHQSGSTSSKKLGVVSAINLLGFLLELAGGLAFGSIALLTDAFHMVFDAVAYVVAFTSAYVAENWGENDSWNFGYHRIETFSAFFNGALLIPMAGFIIWESYQRFLSPVQIGVVPTIAIGSAGLLINLLSIYYLRGGQMSLNEKGAFYHLLGDVGGSLAVIVSTATIYLTGFKMADPIAALLISVTILWSAWKVLGGSTAILLQKSPVNSAALRERIQNVDNVAGVRDMRIWSLCSQITVASLHVCDSSSTLAQSKRTRGEIRDLLHEAGIDHATIEMEGSNEDKCRHYISHGGYGE